MGNEDFVDYGGFLEFIKQHGRCAITGQAFIAGEQLCMVPLPILANWAFPVWGDYPLGANARAIAFVKASNLNPLGIPLGLIKEATECAQGPVIKYHIAEYKIAEADDNANPEEV